MITIDEMINKLYEECSVKWLEKYNLLSGKNFECRDMAFIKDFTPENPADAYKMEILEDGLETLLKYSFIIEDETEKMKLKQKSELEMLKEKLNKI